MATHAPRARLVFCSSLAGGRASARRPPADGSATRRTPSVPMASRSRARRRPSQLPSAMPSSSVHPLCMGRETRTYWSPFAWRHTAWRSSRAPRGNSLRLSTSAISRKDSIRGRGDPAGCGGLFRERWQPQLGRAHCRHRVAQWADIPQSCRCQRPLCGLLASLPDRGPATLAADLLLTRERAWDLLQPNWTCDDTRARTELAYRPTVSLEEGMRDTAAWYRAQGAAVGLGIRAFGPGVGGRQRRFAHTDRTGPVDGRG